MKRPLSFVILSVFIFSFIHLAYAEIKTFIKDYTYQASEADNEQTCRAIAIEQVKRLCLEELGTYLESHTEVTDNQLKKDEIKTLTAGVVQTKILEQKWDGKEYWLKANVSADPREVAESINKLKQNDKLAQELAESNAEKEAALKEIDRLKAELAQSNADESKQAQYNKAVNQLQAADSFEKGTGLTIAGKYDEAIAAYDQVLNIKPDDAKSYLNRGILYTCVGNYNKAVNDINQAMRLNPANANEYYKRAVASKQFHESNLSSGKSRQQFANQPKQKQLTSKQYDKFLDWERQQYYHQRNEPQFNKSARHNPGISQHNKTTTHKFAPDNNSHNMSHHDKTATHKLTPVNHSHRMSHHDNTTNIPQFAPGNDSHRISQHDKTTSPKFTPVNHSHRMLQHDKATNITHFAPGNDSHKISQQDKTNKNLITKQSPGHKNRPDHQVITIRLEGARPEHDFSSRREQTFDKRQYRERHNNVSLRQPTNHEMPRNIPVQRHPNHEMPRNIPVQRHPNHEMVRNKQIQNPSNPEMQRNRPSQRPLPNDEQKKRLTDERRTKMPQQNKNPHSEHKNPHSEHRNPHAEHRNPHAVHKNP